VLGQKFLVSAVLYMETRNAAMDDDISLAVDYNEVAHFINDVMTQAEYKLIETVAEQVAREVLIKFKYLNAIEVTIKKPWAPILLPMDTVSITIRREWTRVYAGIGSNIGNRRMYIDNAYAGIRNNRFCKRAYMSTIIETEPYGYSDQENFLNGVVCFDTLYSPSELLEFFHRLEEDGNRTREVHWGPRTIDLDILFYGDRVIQKEDLIIPHKGIPLRRFVLEPLSEIAPFFVHPVFNKTVSELYDEWKAKENEKE
jgi:dihydroneopterin aldolase/2-amino-4-hydroxy-6-hydroxymethyldihydropteridine diphosphokinase